MAFTPAECRDALRDVLEAVPNIGMVHTVRKKLRDETAIRRLCIDPALGKIRAWFISPASANFAVTVRNPGSRGIGVQGGGNDITMFQFQIEGYAAFEDSEEDADSSEAAFQDLVWTICLELNDYGVIPGVTAHQQTPADVEAFGFVTLAGQILCHHARINIGIGGRTRPR